MCTGVEKSDLGRYPALFPCTRSRHLSGFRCSDHLLSSYLGISGGSGIASQVSIASTTRHQSTYAARMSILLAIATAVLAPVHGLWTVSCDMIRSIAVKARRPDVRRVGWAKHGHVSWLTAGVAMRWLFRGAIVWTVSDFQMLHRGQDWQVARTRRYLILGMNMETTTERLKLSLYPFFARNTVYCAVRHLHSERCNSDYGV